MSESPPIPHEIPNHSYDHWGDDSPEARAQRRQERINRSLIWLRERGIELTLLNEANAHYRFDIYDYWPTTQVFMNRATKKLGKGLGPFYDHFRKHYKLQYGTEWVVPPITQEIGGIDYVPYVTPKINGSQ